MTGRGARTSPDWTRTSLGLLVVVVLRHCVAMGNQIADERTSRTVQRLVGIYDADSTVRGELTYWIGARVGRAHCALCDITHGLLRERAEWKMLKAGLPVPFLAFHRDDRPMEITAAVGEIVPVVVAHTSGGVVRLLGPQELEVCDGSPRNLIAAIHQSADAAGLTWPPPPG